MKEQSRLDNQKTTLDTQDTDNIGYTRHRQHWIHKTQTTLDTQDTDNIGYTRHRQH